MGMTGVCYYLIGIIFGDFNIVDVSSVSPLVVTLGDGSLVDIVWLYSLKLLYKECRSLEAWIIGSFFGKEAIDFLCAKKVALSGMLQMSSIISLLSLLVDEEGKVVDW